MRQDMAHQRAMPAMNATISPEKKGKSGTKASGTSPKIARASAAMNGRSSSPEMNLKVFAIFWGAGLSFAGAAGRGARCGDADVK